MISSQDPTKEVSLVIENAKPIGDENPRNWIQDMTTFLLGGGYPQGLDELKEGNSDYSLSLLSYWVGSFPKKISMVPF